MDLNSPFQDSSTANSPSQGSFIGTSPLRDSTNSSLQGQINNSDENQSVTPRTIGPSIRIMQINVEGSFQSKCEYLARLAHEQKVDVICVQEHHINQESDLPRRAHIEGFELLGYTLSSIYGSAIYKKCSLTDCTVSRMSDTNNLEIIVARIGSLNLVSVYKPPATQITSFTLPTVLHPVLFLGDFNCHHTAWGYAKSDKNGDELLAWSEMNNIHLVFDPKGRRSFRSRRWKSETYPDLCFASEDATGRMLPVNRSILNGFPRSQHRPALISIGIEIPLLKSTPRPRWNFAKSDWTTFSAKLDATVRFIQPSVENYNRFVRAIIATAKRTIPRGYRKEYTPGWTTETEEAYEEFISTNDPESAHKLLASLDASRKDKWESCLKSMDFTHSSRRSWNVLRKLGSAPQYQKQSSSINPNEIAKRMQDLTKSVKTDKPFAKAARSKLIIFFNTVGTDDFFSKPFSPVELDTSLKNIKTNKAAGPDEIYPEFLLHLGKVAKRWLLQFFNVIRETNIVPRAFKQSKVIAMLKPGKSTNEATSYRPISLLSVTYKLLERLVYNRIYPAVDDVIPPEQAGFRASRSCADQVLALSSYIEAGYQRGLKTSVAFVDLSAAYDTVWIDGLLNKISDIIPCTKMLRLIKTLLGPRHFKVHLGEKSSRCRLVKNGLPQGSVLAPLLFNIYIRDMPTTRSNKFAYADDLALAYQSRSFEQGELALTEDLKTMGDYYTQWRLRPNPTKTEVSSFHLTNCLAKRKLKVTFCGETVKHNFTPKYLGVTLDRSLTFKPHIENVKQKVKTRINIIRRLAGTSWGASAAVLRTSALALVYSTAEYCAPVWYRSAHTNKVDTQLNEVMRLISGVIKSTPLPWLPVLSHIPPPKLRRYRAAANEWEKCAQSNRPKPMPIRETLDELPTSRLGSRFPIWTDERIKNKFDLNEAWRSEWYLFEGTNTNLVSDPTKKLPGFDAERKTWTRLNRFRSNHGKTNHHLHKWGLRESPQCDCGAPDQTLSHVVNECPLRCFPGGILELHKYTPDAASWLKNLDMEV